MKTAELNEIALLWYMLRTRNTLCRVKRMRCCGPTDATIQLRTSTCTFNVWLCYTQVVSNYASLRAFRCATHDIGSVKSSVP